MYGYVLGLPFMQAFHVVFDYEKNRVGFGNKRKGRQGAFLYGIPDPKPEDKIPATKPTSLPENNDN